ERGKELQRSRKKPSTVEEIEQTPCAGSDETVAYRRRDDCAGIEQELGTGCAREVLFADWVEAVAVGSGRHPEQPAVVFIRPPRQQRREFNQQLFETFDVIVMDAMASFGYRPLESLSQSLLYFFDQVQPAWKSIFARHHKLGITMRQRQLGLGQIGTCPSDGVCIAGLDVASQFLGLLAK